MLNFRKNMLAIVAVALAGGANAAPLSLGSIGLSGIAPVEVALPFSGAFSNAFTFSLVGSSRVQVGLNTEFWPDDPVVPPTIGFILSGGAGAGSFLPQISFDADSFFAGMTFDGLAPGNEYTLTINGSEAGVLGNTYSLQLAALRVPEPATVALMLASLGLLGLSAGRRKALSGEQA